MIINIRNEIRLIGRIIALKEMSSTTGVENLFIALSVVDPNRKDENGYFKNEVFPINIFGNLKKFVESNFVVGQQILVSGSLGIKEYTTSDNKKRSNSMYIIAQSIQPLESKDQVLSRQRKSNIDDLHSEDFIFEIEEETGL